MSMSPVMEEMKNSRSEDALLLPLRVWPKDEADQKPLSSIIQRINQEKGHFRHVTESSLAEEIQAMHFGETDSPEFTEDAAKIPEEGEARTAFLVSAKEEILKQVGQAHREAYFALEFISLLLSSSKETSRQAETSMSAYLKQHVPRGSLGAERVQAPAEPPVEKNDRELVQMGWKLQSLNSAADSLIESATRLGTEMEQESWYWEEVLAIDRKKWSLCRMPRERHTLGVQFGFMEAAAEFRDGGLAALRRGEGGKVVLDQGPNKSIPKALRVRLASCDNQVLASSSISTVGLSDCTSIEDQILQARNTIYEEELFHELTREARLLTNHGVRITGSSVTAALPVWHQTTVENSNVQPRQVWIDLVSLDDEHLSWDMENVQTGQQGAHGPASTAHLAEGISMAFRILLSNAHTQNLRRRSQMPPPLSERRRPSPPHFILRPVLNHLFHRCAVDSLRGFLAGSVVAPLTVTGVKATIDLSIGVNCALDKFQSPAKNQHTRGGLVRKRKTSEQVIDAFSHAVETIFKLVLPGPALFEVKVSTQLSPPLLGTEYVVSSKPLLSYVSASPNNTATTLEPSVTASPAATMRLRSKAELEKYLHYLATLSLVSEIQSYQATSDLPRWLPTSSFNELTLACPKTGRTKKLWLQVSERGIEVKWRWMSGDFSKQYRGDGDERGSETDEGEYRWPLGSGADSVHDADDPMIDDEEADGDESMRGEEEARTRPFKSLEEVIRQAGR